LGSPLWQINTKSINNSDSGSSDEIEQRLFESKSSKLARARLFAKLKVAAATASSDDSAAGSLSLNSDSKAVEEDMSKH